LSCGAGSRRHIPDGATSVQKACVLDVRSASKSFGRVRVLNGISLSLDRGEMVGLIGASGSGKSTLIRAIAGLTPLDHDTGYILLFGEPMQRDGRVARAARDLRVRIGVIFQQFNLVPRLSVLTNVCLGVLGKMSLPRAAFGWFRPEEQQRAMAALDRVGI